MAAANPHREISPPGRFEGDTFSRRSLFPQGLASQKEIWKLEQHIVRALVRVEPDRPQDQSSIEENMLFHFLPENQKGVFSSSTEPELYGGVDVSFPACEDEEAVAVYVVLDQRTMQVVYKSHEYFTLDTPYISGFLAFREISPLERLVNRQIEEQPQFTPKSILVDGNGILHPRHAGIACFLGVRTGVPTIGIGKSLLNVAGWTRSLVDEKVDEFLQNVHNMIESRPPAFAESLARHRGSILQKYLSAEDIQNEDGQMDAKPHAWRVDRKQILQDLAPYCNAIAIQLAIEESMKGPGDETDPQRFPVLGSALIGLGSQSSYTARSKARAGSTKPIFVSVGHGMSLHEAVKAAASLSTHRIPEPVRQADLYGRELMRQRAEAQSA